MGMGVGVRWGRRIEWCGGFGLKGVYIKNDLDMNRRRLRTGDGLYCSSAGCHCLYRADAIVSCFEPRTLCMLHMYRKCITTQQKTILHLPSLPPAPKRLTVPHHPFLVSSITRAVTCLNPKLNLLLHLSLFNLFLFKPPRS